MSTQIQLNSFLETTYVYMISGEVEGVIKCKVPKDLGAVVSILNNKTDMILEKVEHLDTEVFDNLIAQLEKAIASVETKEQELILLSNTINEQEIARQNAINELVNEMEVTNEDIQDIMDMIGGL